MPLTGRQIEILAAYLRFGSAKGAAAELHLTRLTVESALKEIRQRLGCTTDQAIALGVRDGWLPFPAGTPLISGS